MKDAPTNAQDRLRGSVFTRPWIAELVLELAGYVPTQDLAARRALEPACGTGAFLVPMVRRLAASCRAHGRELGDVGDAIRAFDIDASAVREARAATTRALVDEGLASTAARALSDLWVRRRDFLVPGPKPASADWIIGNPPYVRTEAIPVARQRQYRQRWPTMKGRADLYVGFLEAGLRALRPDGVLAVICADRWMRNAYGRDLRRLVEREYAVDVSLLLHEVDAFESRVFAYPAVVVLRRGKQGKALVAEAEPGFGPDEASEVVDVFRTGRVTRHNGQVSLNWSAGWFAETDSWPSAHPARLALLNDLERRFPLLEATGVKVRVGVATGANAVFVLDDPGVVEHKLTVPYIAAREISTGQFAWKGRYLLNPWTPEGALIDLDAHPKAAAHLRRHEAILRARHVAQKAPEKWWRTIDRIQPLVQTADKLLIPDLSESVEPVLDRGRFYPDHSLYYVTGAGWDLEILGGLLLSDLARLFVEAYSVRMANGYLRVSAQYLRRIRVPEPASLSEVVREELRAAFRDRDRQRASAASEEAYGLSDNG